MKFSALGRPALVGASPFVSISKRATSHARTWCVLVFALSLSGLTHAAYTQVISFGDSLSDVGNNGRFSDGPVWVEVIATNLGLTPATSSSSPSGGGNYAWGGARITDNTSAPSLQDQINTITANETLTTLNPNALYTVLIGGNDLIAFNSDDNYGYTELAADAHAVAAEVQKLINAGAQSILIANLPDLGIYPGCDGIESYCTGVTTFFNDELVGGLNSLDHSKLIIFDLFDLSQNIVAGSPDNGFTNVDDACLDHPDYTGPGSCDAFLFWDIVHPTSTAHSVIGQHALAATAVPVPAAGWLFMSALLGLVGRKRLSRR